jgi:hypothetical protein
VPLKCTNTRDVQSLSVLVLNKIQTSCFPSDFEKMRSHHGTYSRCRYYCCEQTEEDFFACVGCHFPLSEVNQGQLYEV